LPKQDDQILGRIAKIAKIVRIVRIVRKRGKKTAPNTKLGANCYNIESTHGPTTMLIPVLLNVVPNTPVLLLGNA